MRGGIWLARTDATIHDAKSFQPRFMPTRTFTANDVFNWRNDSRGSTVALDMAKAKRERMRSLLMQSAMPHHSVSRAARLRRHPARICSWAALVDAITARASSNHAP